MTLTSLQNIFVFHWFFEKYFSPLTEFFHFFVMFGKFLHKVWSTLVCSARRNFFCNSGCWFRRGGSGSEGQDPSPATFLGVGWGTPTICLKPQDLKGFPSSLTLVDCSVDVVFVAHTPILNVSFIFFWSNIIRQKSSSPFCVMQFQKCAKYVIWHLGQDGKSTSGPYLVRGNGTERNGRRAGAHTAMPRAQMSAAAGSTAATAAFSAVCTASSGAVHSVRRRVPVEPTDTITQLWTNHLADDI